MRFAVVTCNYNHARLLDRCIQSILNQKRLPNEYIIVNDGSTDNSLEVIYKYQSQFPIKLICNEKNLGVVTSLNKALAAVSADYIAFISADDFICPGYFDCLTLMEEDALPTWGVITTMPLFAHENEGERPKLSGQWPAIKTYYNANNLIDSFRNASFWFAGHASFINTMALKENGGFNLSLGYHCDWVLFHKIAFQKGMVFLPSTGSVLVVRKKSLSSNNKFTVKLKIYLNIINDIVSSGYATQFSKTTLLAQLDYVCFFAILVSPYRRLFLDRIILKKFLRKFCSKLLPSFLKKHLKQYLCGNKDVCCYSVGS